MTIDDNKFTSVNAFIKKAVIDTIEIYGNYNCDLSSENFYLFADYFEDAIRQEALMPQNKDKSVIKVSYGTVLGSADRLIASAIIASGISDDASLFKDQEYSYNELLMDKNQVNILKDLTSHDLESDNFKSTLSIEYQLIKLYTELATINDNQEVLSLLPEVTELFIKAGNIKLMGHHFTPDQTQKIETIRQFTFSQQDQDFNDYISPKMCRYFYQRYLQPQVYIDRICLDTLTLASTIEIKTINEEPYHDIAEYHRLNNLLNACSYLGNLNINQFVIPIINRIRDNNPEIDAQERALVLRKEYQ